MKKILLLFVAACALSSCTTDVRDNSPAFEGLRNGSRWRAPGVVAYLGAGGDLTITGANRFETLELHTTSTAPGEYILGNSATRTATFTVATKEGVVEKVYQTGVGIGDGKITIEEYDEVKKTITGKFLFNAIDTEAEDPEDPTAAETMNFTSGVFYEVPVYPTL
ncbi:MAG: hypothetical protein EOO50_11455 [Flavobacterium sp.]|uniref:DUF6252 family protein n=1 Tax=Flavobacterium sp. TaxID=239 RepID=UPI001220707E|nr:DUF6252 family protein [Flavobacterium sp.]RZJ66021.1 MAG: hypothetical protein EOO50_11455 [Flavobacterium sp.]